MTFKNHVHWNTGVPMSEETKLKISETMKGKPLSEEHKQNLRGHIPWSKGKHYSEESKRKMSENNARHWLGKKFAAKHRKNMSLAHKGLPSPLKGRKLAYICTQEHRRNLSIAIKKWHQRRKKRHGS
jgi:hypothetical protein